MPERLQKYLASCGVGSRRYCEDLMQQGRVTVDGEVIREPGFRVQSGKQIVCFNGREVHPETHVYYMLHKPPGHVCTSHDPQGRPRAIDLLPDNTGRVYTVGRLDVDSEGLIIATNDGAFAHELSHPSYEVLKTYELTLNEQLSAETQKQWLEGVTSDIDHLRVISISHSKTDKSGSTYEIELGEGKNRHLRRMADYSGMTVLRLKRVAIGSLSIGSLKRGESRSLKRKEIDMLSPKNKKESRPDN